MWNTAWELLQLQPQLREELHRTLSSYPISGLYDDEASASADAFAAFCTHVRKSLIESPRAMLLRNLDARLLELHDRCPIASALHTALGLQRGADISTVADRVANQERGEIHRMWMLASAACSKPADPLSCDPILRRRAIKGLAAKHAARGKAPPSKDEEEAMLQRSAAVSSHALEDARSREATLHAELSNDTTWQHYQQVQRLWIESGAAKLWDEFRTLDASEGRERASNGRKFEANQATLCFAMVAIILAGETQDVSRFWYRRSAAWIDQRARSLGEIDLVILEDVDPSDQGTIVRAILEMKTGCFELASALAQHEPKLDAAARAALNGEMAPQIAESATWRSRRFCLPAGPSVTIPVFIATLLPPHPFVIGAEPSLLKAVCDALYGRPTEQQQRRSAAHAEVRSKPSSLLPPDEVEAIVRGKLGKRLCLSPLGCLKQNAARVLIVEAPSLTNSSI